ncbi:hypothetical protein [Aestuariibius sp. HNIBRBA575]|uniref:hypothetical protein n=1 Tax=Aestuariibius sp. HNIBRBA575 TaxID=3233343 RepID=UPI0034A4D950
MSSSDKTLKITRRGAVLGLVTMLAGCGFAPVYGPDGSANTLRNSVQVVAPADRFGFHFSGQIAARLGPEQVARYRLEVELSQRESALGITDTRENTRFSIEGVAKFTLIASDTAQIVTQGTVRTFTSYSATSTPVANTAAKRDAEDRLATSLADLTISQLLIAVPAS